MSVLNQQNILQISVKYLESLNLVENASTHTLRAYARDISDFIEPILALKLQVKITSDQVRILIMVLNSHRAEKIAKPGLSARSHPICLEKGDLGQKFPNNSNYFIENDVEFSGENLLKALLKLAQIKWTPLSAATRNRKFSTIKSFFGWLYKNNYIETQLNHFVNTPKTPKKLPNYISVDEALELVKKLKSNLNNNEDKNRYRDFALISLLYGGGLRVSEACHLKWKDIHFENKSITLTGKGEKQRVVTPADICFQSLKALKGGNTDYVFGEKPLNTRKAYSICEAWGHKMGLLKPLNPHALRHSFATHLLSSGANLRVLQDLLGHSSLTATEKYTHLTTDELARTLNKHHPLAKK